MQIKSQTLQAEYDHVYSADPALDRTKPDWREKYERALELSKAEELPLLPGATPVVFRLKHLTPTEKATVKDAGGTARGVLFAARIALVGVSGAADENGNAYQVKRTAQIGGVAAVAEDQVEALSAATAAWQREDDLDLFEELGLRVLRSFNPRKG